MRFDARLILARHSIRVSHAFLIVFVYCLIHAYRVVRSATIQYTAGQVPMTLLLSVHLDV